MELVGAYVHHEEKNGLDAGEIAGLDPLGVRATTDLDEILALDADCVLYNPPMERYDEIVRMLASGKNVVSIMAGWNPKKRSGQGFRRFCSILSGTARPTCAASQWAHRRRTALGGSRTSCFPRWACPR